MVSEGDRARKRVTTKRDTWDSVVDYLFALLEVPEFEPLVFKLGVEAERDARRGRRGLPLREQDASDELTAPRESALGRHAMTRHRRLESVLPVNLRYLGRLIVCRGSVDAVGDLFARVDVLDPGRFSEPRDRERFLRLVARRLAGHALSNTDSRHLARCVERMNPRHAGLDYADGGIPMLIGAPAYESATSAAAGSSALTLAATGYPNTGLVVAHVRDDEVIIVPSEQFTINVGG